MKTQEAYDLALEIGYPNSIRAAGRKKGNLFPENLRFTRVAKLSQKRGDLRGIPNFRTSDCGCFHDGSCPDKEIGCWFVHKGTGPTFRNAPDSTYI